MNSEIKDFIGIFENAFSKEYCEAVINYFDQAVESGFGETRKQQGAKNVHKNDTQVYAHSETSIHYASSLTKEFNDILWSEIYKVYSSEFDILDSYESHSNFAFKVQKTEVGQGYHMWHSENDNKANSNRILAWILYLNDVEEGGETEFLYYHRRIKPKTGTMLLWPAGFTHTHRGNPPISNTKYIATGWIEF